MKPGNLGLRWKVERWKGPKSLQSRIILQMLLISLLPILVITVVIYVGMWNSQESASDSVDESRTILQEETVGANKGGLAWLLSYDMEKWAAQLIENVRSWVRNEQVIKAARFKDDEIISDEARKFLGDEIIDMADFEDVYIVSLSGDLITKEIGYSEPELEAANASWRMGKEQGLYVSDLYLPSEGVSTTYKMDVAVLIEDMVTDEPLGVLVSVIQVYPSSLGQEYESKVIDHRIIVWDNTGKIVTDTGNERRYIEDNVSNWTNAEQRVMENITNDAKLIKPSYVINDEVVAGYARAANESIDTRIAGFEGLGWTVMVEQDAGKAFAALSSIEMLADDLEENTQNTILMSVGIFAIVAILALAVAIWLSRVFTKPILKLNHGVQEIMNGNLSHRVSSVEEDEIGQLSRAFDEMTSTVQQSQAELKDYSLNLERKVQERTDELQKELVERKRIEQELKNKTTMLIQTEKLSSMGTMVAGVAHELNNPMTGIIQYTQFCLRRTDEDDRRYSVLKDIEQESRRCSDIIRNMLTFSRMEAEGEEGYQKDSIPAVVDRVLKLLAYRLRAENVTVTQHHQDDMPMVSMKINSIQQIFLNILGNAMDALQEKEDRSIRIESYADDGFVKINIIDNGPGISPAVLKKIFDPFYTTKTVGKGTGLGLSISQSICIQHGGRLECESEVGMGATFRIVLPIDQNLNKKKEGV